jgi:hypothetical protein
MEPVPYEIREDDVDEVLTAYGSVGSDWTEEQRAEARRIVMSRILELNETVRAAPEERRLRTRDGDADRAEPLGIGPGDESPARRELALGAIEDLLIREGFLDAADDEDRVFPIVTDRGRAS